MFFESYAFQAANALAGQLSTDFKLFFSFDYLGSGQPWADGDVINVLNTYGPNGAHFLVNGKPFVSTFEGPSNSDVNGWANIRSSVSSGIYFVPDWTSLGPDSTKYNLGLVDGACVSPWFYTDLSAFTKAWVWRGDDMWSRRWQQTLEILPEFVEIATWNDFGESHYIGPIFDSGLPSGDGYTDGYPHVAWLETLPYQIAAYKSAYNAANAPPSVAAGEEKIVFWYRTSPASAGSTTAAGNNCKTDANPNGYQTCYPIPDMLEDAVFAIVLASASGTATINIGGASQEFSVNAGINSISLPFGGNTGTVSVSMGSISGSGTDITAQPAGGVANFNAWVGCAGSCS
nr:glucan endo-1,3-alpha-glucosidase agn1 [Quercus suber]